MNIPGGTPVRSQMAPTNASVTPGYNQGGASMSGSGGTSGYDQETSAKIQGMLTSAMSALQEMQNTKNIPNTGKNTTAEDSSDIMQKDTPQNPNDTEFVYTAKATKRKVHRAAAKKV